MQVVTRKSDVKEYLKPCLTTYQQEGVGACVEIFERQILSKKVKFPLLEFCAHELYKEIKEEEQLIFCDEVEKLKTEGGNVILGIILQNRLVHEYNQSIEKTTEYLTKANVWYVCDIIGERVYGVALLHQPEKTIPIIQKLIHHPINWVVRSLGAGIHYAVRKGLPPKEVETVFPLLLVNGNVKDKEIRQGIGWAAKTTARFHPDLIAKFQEEIQDQEQVANWFRRKVEIGLSRHQYAKRSRS